MNSIRIILFPVASIYGLIIFIRNLFYDIGIFKSQSFDISVISIGNLRVGGTGKSPHIEYLIRLLKDKNKVATLSRGYSRRSKGFLLASPQTEVYDIGDEPLQFKTKFPEAAVAVDANRRNGIRKLQQLIPSLNVILLDDAFQHRAVKPGLSILLTNYDNLYTDDYILPVGNLREWRKSANRADIIIVTRIPEPFSPMEKRIIRERLNLQPYQKVYFSRIISGDLIPFTRTGNENATLKIISKEYFFERKFSIVLLTGIANSLHLYEYLKGKSPELRHLKYRDHHYFTPTDIQRLKQIFNNIANENKIIITTEKDAMRLGAPGIKEMLSDLPVFYLPIEVGFHENDAEEFNEQIISYVRKNQVNRSLYQKQG